jgi:hypothetical protein
MTTEQYESSCEISDHLSALIAENIQARALLNDAASYCHAAWMIYHSGEGQQLAAKIRAFIEQTQIEQTQGV